jgi:hypothetical protein
VAKIITAVMNSFFMVVAPLLFFITKSVRFKKYFFNFTWRFTFQFN